MAVERCSKTFKPAYAEEFWICFQTIKIHLKIKRRCCNNQGCGQPYLNFKCRRDTFSNKMYRHRCLVKWKKNRIFDILILIFLFVSPCPKNRCYTWFWTPCVAVHTIKISAELGSGNVNKTYIRPPGFFVNAETFFVRLM